VLAKSDIAEYQVRQHRAWAEQGFDGIPLGHHAPFSSKLSGDNGYSTSHDKESGGGILGRTNESSYRKRSLGSHAARLELCGRVYRGSDCDANAVIRMNTFHEYE